MRPPSPTARQVEAWRQLEAGGVTRAEIGRRFGYSKSVVSRALGPRKTLSRERPLRYRPLATWETRPREEREEP